MEKIKLSINGNSSKAFLSYFDQRPDFEIVEQSADVALITELKKNTDAVSAKKKFFVDAIVFKPIVAKVLSLVAEGKIGAVQSADFSLNAPEGVSEEKLRSCIYLLLAICGEKIKDKMSQDCASGYRHGFVALQLKNGSNMALVNAMLHVLIEENLYDKRPEKKGNIAVFTERPEKSVWIYNAGGRGFSNKSRIIKAMK